MYEILDLSIRLFNPMVDLWLFLNRFINEQLALALIALTSLVLLSFIFKFHKWLFVLFLLFLLYGFLGLYSANYFSQNFKEFEINTPPDLEERIIGEWCKDDNRITLQKANTIKMSIDGHDLEGTWEYSRAHIEVINSGSRYNDIRIVGFKDELFLNVSNPSPVVESYSDLEYARCD
jgi:hypothetical protein